MILILKNQALELLKTGSVRIHFQKNTFQSMNVRQTTYYQHNRRQPIATHLGIKVIVRNTKWIIQSRYILISNPDHDNNIDHIGDPGKHG
jgi:hypothetical protein